MRWSFYVCVCVCVCLLLSVESFLWVLYVYVHVFDFTGTVKDLKDFFVALTTYIHIFTLLADALFTSMQCAVSVHCIMNVSWILKVYVFCLSHTNEGFTESFSSEYYFKEIVHRLYITYKIFEILSILQAELTKCTNPKICEGYNWVPFYHCKTWILFAIVRFTKIVTRTWCSSH
jgi:hypothetical protein